MTENTKVPIMMQQINMPSFASARIGQDGIAFGQMGNEVIIAITHAGLCHYVRLHDDNLDHVAGKLANSLEAATRAEFPSLGGMQ